MHNFTPVSGLVGGALIGLASALLMLLTGRIAGISGIFGGLLPFNTTERDWRLAFLAGLPRRCWDRVPESRCRIRPCREVCGWSSFPDSSLASAAGWGAAARPAMAYAASPDFRRAR
jgi:hypothetical protein